MNPKKICKTFNKLYDQFNWKVKSNFKNNEKERLSQLEKSFALFENRIQLEKPENSKDQIKYMKNYLINIIAPYFQEKLRHDIDFKANIEHFNLRHSESIDSFFDLYNKVFREINKTFS